ncbi:sulfatase-like hydrolase/transferase [Luteolibacter luteus]|uniref:Sulfatase-like hydrolase/transferase n=1 Tax=Luteolibacter luteus TaxID=2728835 RepID=A0A858RG14_9BACT|nr:sulfatase-like hydrolase/transferase [Luteolibacter luteus]QJE95488.1 sulfatase-like hydrolase/transferase [Luteolibacter luteus]
MKFLSCIFSLGLAASALARPATEKPNVIVVLLDDCGYGDFSHTGNPSIYTPNVSRMVSEGANFPQFYSASAACSHSRYGILTGRQPLRSGLKQWAIGPDEKRHIHVKEVTLAEGLKEQGYATAIFGKWHLGTPNEANGRTPDALPLAHGFDRWLGTNVSNDYEKGSDLVQGPSSGEGPALGYEYLARNIAMNVPLQEGLTKRYADAAVDFIREKKDQPFFIYMTPNMPHLPVHASDEFKGKSRRGLYGDCIQEIDHQIGRLRAALQEAGVEKNTLIVLSSDNGPWIRYQDTASHPMYAEARTLVGSAFPFRDGKASTWEGGQRVVGVWCWPGTIPAATVVQEPASTLDVLPTALALAGAKLPADRIIDGRDIRALLAASAEQKVEGFKLIYADSISVKAARFGPWKIHTGLTSQIEAKHGFTASEETPLLFQIEQDFSERIDRAAERPEKVEEGRAIISAFKDSLAKEPSFWDERKP